MYRVPFDRREFSHDRRADQAAMHQLGMPAFDPVRRRWPGADWHPPDGAARRSRILETIARAARRLAAKRSKP